VNLQDGAYPPSYGEAQPNGRCRGPPNVLAHGARASASVKVTEVSITETSGWKINMEADT